ncbi:MAG: hypothetical protein HRT58_07465 [Crocinitomicaceae bacterium]|nr:hypothetical protein [Flavobacteriales bacterium]NQZ35487.1 hypothetical protein [Crocinitomicaceae bacterium]
MKLTHFILIPFLALLLFSCESDSKKVDPLFYQISTVDSAKYSNQLHQIMKQEALDYQEEQMEIRNSSMCNMPPPYYDGDILSIELTTESEYLIEGIKNRKSLSSVVFDFFIKNRNLTTDIFLVSDTDFLKYPMYRVLTVNYLMSDIERKEQELADIKNMKGADSVLIDYYAAKVNSTKERLDLLELFKTDTLAFVSDFTFVEIKRANSESGYNLALDEVIDGLFHLRDYECWRYFGESYVSLFGRAQTRKWQIDSDKLAGLKMLHPIQIRDFDRTARAIPPPQEEF